MKSNTLSKGTIFKSALALATAAATSLPLLPILSVQAQSQTIKVDGSSTVFPILEGAADLFQKANQGTKVTVGVSGTGAGFRKFCAGETDISNASRPISKKEMDACKKKGITYIELPIAYDGLAVVVNPQNTWATTLTTAELKKMWEPAAQGKITNWSQIRAGFPSVPLKLYGPGAQSGTFDYFTEAINGKAKATRTDYTPSEDDNVLVQGVSRERGGLAYFGKAYLDENKDKLKAVAIDAGKGAVVPNDETVRNGKYSPLSRPLFIYISTKSAARREVSQFVTYIIQNGGKLANTAKYVALPSRGYTLAMTKFSARKAGTVFGGEEQIGLTIEQLLTAETKE